jgi:hypothetical protein
VPLANAGMRPESRNAYEERLTGRVKLAAINVPKEEKVPQPKPRTTGQASDDHAGPPRMAACSSIGRSSRIPHLGPSAERCASDRRLALAGELVRLI